jgi:hypothetical protein
MSKIFFVSGLGTCVGVNTCDCFKGAQNDKNVGCKESKHICCVLCEGGECVLFCNSFFFEKKKSVKTPAPTVEDAGGGLPAYGIVLIV